MTYLIRERDDTNLHPQHHPRRDTKINRRRIRTLERRAKHLETRPGSELSGSYDEAELAALQWAITVLREWIQNDPYWVFVDTTGGHGRWREIGFPYYDADLDEWFVYESATENRRATESEVEWAKRR